MLYSILFYLFTLTFVVLNWLIILFFLSFFLSFFVGSVVWVTQKANFHLMYLLWMIKFLYLWVTQKANFHFMHYEWQNSCICKKNVAHAKYSSQTTRWTSDSN